MDKKVGQEGAETMKSQPRLERTPSGTFQYRLIIPKRLQETLGRKVIKKSLKTSDKTKAKQLASIEDTYWFGLINKAEDDLKNGVQDIFLQNEESDVKTKVIFTESGELRRVALHKYKTLTDSQIRAISMEYLRTNLGYDEVYRGPDFDEFQEVINEGFIRSATGEGVRRAIAFSEGLDFYYELVGIFVESACQIDFEYLDEEIKKKLTRECLKSYQRAGHISIQRNSGIGNFDLDELAPVSQTYKPFKYSWDNLFNDWKAEEFERPDKTIQGFAHSLYDLKKFLNGKPIQNVTVDDVVNYKKYLSTDNKYSRQTIENKLSHLRAIFQVGKMNEKLHRNVFEGRTNVSKNVNQEKSRISIPEDVLSNLFKSSIFTSSEKINSWSNSTNRWMIAIAYGTGARPEEIAQLRVEDLEEFQGFYLLNISPNDKSGNKAGTVKNENSIRKVPVHNSLIEAGLLDFFALKKEQNHKYLFHDFKGDKFGRRYAKWGDWFNRYVKTHELLIQKTTFYSLKDCFTDMCRKVDMAMPKMNAIMGHSNQNISDKYGATYFEDLNQRMQLVKFTPNIPKIQNHDDV